MGGTTKPSILKALFRFKHVFLFINHPFWGTRIFGNHQTAKLRKNQEAGERRAGAGGASGTRASSRLGVLGVQ